MRIQGRGRRTDRKLPTFIFDFFQLKFAFQNLPLATEKAGSCLLTQTRKLMGIFIQPKIYDYCQHSKLMEQGIFRSNCIQSRREITNHAPPRQKQRGPSPSSHTIFKPKNEGIKHRSHKAGRQITRRLSTLKPLQQPCNHRQNPPFLAAQPAPSFPPPPSPEASCGLPPPLSHPPVLGIRKICRQGRSRGWPGM